ncbi:RNA-directed DNA polymerase reverse transcriptase family protein [Gossypium australe]|uniref:RNA-directed DNA polymerase reverse transcriptase family protein n=1 Tax=Gossypium australe TaxID=47621 RepID=A0A5B6WEZ8_9ROSI|nr:RNA-directed DNA polymerase reverse transcriptase family protein [Gossypium australe]
MEIICVNFLWQKGKINLSLLAKQGWRRLVSFPNSLLARTLKAKYYPDSDFMNARLGNIPSYTWKSICTNFLWQKCHGKRGIHLCEWRKLYELKENGGLGFRSLAKFNLSLFAKQGWRLINFPNSLLARTLKAKCYSDLDFLSARFGNIPPYTWKSIWVAKGILKKRLCWRVKTG